MLWAEPLAARDMVNGEHLKWGHMVTCRNIAYLCSLSAFVVFAACSSENEDTSSTPDGTQTIVEMLQLAVQRGLLVLRPLARDLFVGLILSRTQA